MRIRTAVAVTVLTTGMSFPLAGAALAADLDCSDFATQAQAQAVYDRDTSDPNRLDADGNGVACETLPRGAVGSGEKATGDGNQDAGVAPSGAVEAGAGGAADDGDSLPLVPLSLAGGALLAAGGVVLVRRRPVRQSD